MGGDADQLGQATREKLKQFVARIEAAERAEQEALLDMYMEVVADQ